MKAYPVRVELMDWVVIEAETEEEAIEEAKRSVFRGDITAEVERVSGIAEQQSNRQ
jgi:hypothetical protein